MLAVAASGYLLSRSGLMGTLTAQRVVRLVLFAYMGWRTVVVLARAVAQPQEPRLRRGTPVMSASVHNVGSCACD